MWADPVLQLSEVHRRYLECVTQEDSRQAGYVVPCERSEIGGSGCAGCRKVLKSCSSLGERVCSGAVLGKRVTIGLRFPVVWSPFKVLQVLLGDRLRLRLFVCLLSLSKCFFLSLP